MDREARLSDEQAERTLTLCEAIRTRPGIYISRFDWFTVNAFWHWYFTALGDAVRREFWQWSLNFLGEPTANVDPVDLLRRRHGLATDVAGEAALNRERAAEIAALVCDVVAPFVSEHRE